MISGGGERTPSSISTFVETSMLNAESPGGMKAIMSLEATVVAPRCPNEVCACGSTCCGVCPSGGHTDGTVSAAHA